MGETYFRSTMTAVLAQAVREQGRVPPANLHELTI
jgi:hypothetical protein